MMDLAEKKVLLGTIIEKMEKSQERKLRVTQELTKDTATLRRVNDMKTNGDTLPNDCGYTDFPHWIEVVTKQIATSEESLKRLAEEKVEIEALKYFVNNA